MHEEEKKDTYDAAFQKATKLQLKGQYSFFQDLFLCAQIYRISHNSIHVKDQKWNCRYITVKLHFLLFCADGNRPTAAVWKLVLFHGVDAPRLM